MKQVTKLQMDIDEINLLRKLKGGPLALQGVLHRSVLSLIAKGSVTKVWDFDKGLWVVSITEHGTKRVEGYLHG